MNNKMPYKRPDGSIAVRILRPGPSIAAIRRARAGNDSISVESELGQFEAVFLGKSEGKHFHILMNGRPYCMTHDPVDDIMYIVPADIPDLQLTKASSLVDRAFAKADKIYRNLPERAQFRDAVKKKEADIIAHFNSVLVDYEYDSTHPCR